MTGASNMKVKRVMPYNASNTMNIVTDEKGMLKALNKYSVIEISLKDLPEKLTTYNAVNVIDNLELLHQYGWQETFSHSGCFTNPDRTKTITSKEICETKPEEFKDRYLK